MWTHETLPKCSVCHIIVQMHILCFLMILTDWSQQKLKLVMMIMIIILLLIYYCYNYYFKIYNAKLIFFKVAALELQLPQCTAPPLRHEYVLPARSRSLSCTVNLSEAAL